MFGPPERAAYLKFRSAFQEVMDPALYEITWLDQQLINGIYRIWPGENSAIITGFRFYPTGAADIEGIVAAGDAQEIASSLIPRAEEWAKSIGCAGALIESREGWERILKPHGWQRHQISLRKVL